MRPGLQPVMRAAVERLRREGKRFDLFDLGDITDLLDALDDCPYCERMLIAEARVAALEAVLRFEGYSDDEIAEGVAALSSEDATRPTGNKQ